MHDHHEYKMEFSGGVSGRLQACGWVLRALPGEYEEGRNDWYTAYTYTLHCSERDTDLHIRNGWEIGLK